jgi:hypothetical protein
MTFIGVLLAASRCNTSKPGCVSPMKDRANCHNAFVSEVLMRHFTRFDVKQDAINSLPHSPLPLALLT